MPFVSDNVYKPPILGRNPHLNTIFSALFRNIQLKYERERIATPDDDFLDLDWSTTGSDQLIIALHGLEGDTNRPYIKGLIRWFNAHGWDGLGMNFRGCSGEPNRKLRSYHLGATDDLHTLIQHVLSLDRYQRIVLAGFSLGGNLLLKYLGEQGDALAPSIKRAVAISVPCDVVSANVEIEARKNWVYVNRFMRSLNEKVSKKANLFPDGFMLPESRKAKNFTEFDEWYTAPINGFASAMDYWTQNSCLPYLSRIRIPFLLINAMDDSFLSEFCFPYNLASKEPFFYLETPRYGGHVGFLEYKEKGAYYTDRRALQFASQG